MTLRIADCAAALALAMAQLAAAAPADADPYADRRAAMVRTIERHADALDRGLGRSAFDARVLAAMGRVPRHEFVPEALRERAYANRPLPIGHGQTISQPLIVAVMTSLVRPGPGDTVLEVGTGSGYQAAVLATLVRRVHTIEILAPLAAAARARLARLGYDNVVVRAGDGYAGWPEAAPFDAIVVTAAPETIPERLIAQLKPGGRMVVPVGSQAGVQRLTVVEKQADGTLRTEAVLAVRFVPMTGGN